LEFERKGETEMDKELTLQMMDGDDLVEEYYMPDGNALIITNAPEVGINIIPTKEDFQLEISENCKIDQSFVRVAKGLCRKYSAHIPQAVNPEMILFTVDRHWEPTEKMSENSKWKIDITKASRWLRIFTGRHFEIKLRQHWLDEWTDAQLEAAILSQLFRINPRGDGAIKKYSVDFQDALMATFGLGYLEPGRDIPSLLLQEINLGTFRQASGQITIDEVLSGSVEDDAAEDSADVVGLCNNPDRECEEGSIRCCLDCGIECGETCLDADKLCRYREEVELTAEDAEAFANAEIPAAAGEPEYVPEEADPYADANGIDPDPAFDEGIDPGPGDDDNAEGVVQAEAGAGNVTPIRRGRQKKAAGQEPLAALREGEGEPA
jgi:hypothetical protein